MRATVPTITVSPKKSAERNESTGAGGSIDRHLYVSVTDWRFRYYIFVMPTNRACKAVDTIYVSPDQRVKIWVTPLADLPH
jgi:hypothetical protein